MEKQQLTLGEFIKKLEAIDKNLIIRFDFGGLTVAGIDSYRGNYYDLALAFCEPNSNENYTTVDSVLKLCKDAIGKTFTGWKGGEFEMNEDTLLWVANIGYVSNTAIVDVLDTFIVV